MIEYAYNKAKNTNTGYTSFEFNYDYFSHIFFEDKTDFYSKFYLVNKLAKEIKNLISICQYNLLYV